MGREDTRNEEQKKTDLVNQGLNTMLCGAMNCSQWSMILYNALR